MPKHTTSPRDIFDAAKYAVIRVGEGCGFIVKARQQRLVITAAHCLPYVPSAEDSDPRDRIYPELLGRGETLTVAAQCAFADPIGDIAVLEEPDNEIFPQTYLAAWQDLTSTHVLRCGDLPNDGQAWILSLNKHWFACNVRHIDGRLWIERPAEKIVGGMSGSPILANDGVAIGVVALRSDMEPIGPQPRLAHNLPAWLAPRHV